MRKVLIAVASLTVVLGGFSIAPSASAADSGLQYSNRTTANGLGSNWVQAVFVDGSNVYAATGPEGYSSPTGGGLSISTDGGATFANKTTTDGLGSNDVRGVFVVGSTIYAATYPVGYPGTGGGLSISTDGGTTWTTKTSAVLGSNFVTSVYVVAGTPNTIYVGTKLNDYTAYDGGLSISTDGGATWTTKKSGLAAGDLCSTVDPSNPGSPNYNCNTVNDVYVNGLNIYLATGRGLVYSNDGGSTFSNVDSGLGQMSAKGVSTSGSNVYVSAHGLNISRDNGATFSDLKFFAENGNGVFTSGSNVYFASWAGLDISTDNAATFVTDTTENCLGDDYIYGVFVTGGVIYAGTQGGLSISNGLGAGCRTSVGGGGGGGGDTSPSETTTPTPTPTPVVVIPVVAAIPPGTNANIPASGLTPGSSVLLVDGTASTLTIKPNKPVEPKSLVATGDGFTMELEGLRSNGQPLGLTNDAALRLELGSTAHVSGRGFAANSDVQVHLFSTDRFLGTIRTDSLGTFDGSVPVPADVELGRHTLQADALGSDNKVRSLSLGVVLEAPAKPVRTAKATVSFGPLSTVLTPKAKSALKSLAQKTKRTATSGLAIGYVQRDNNFTNNASLSKQRALAIVRYLKANGVSAPLSIRGNGALTTKETARIAKISVTYTG